MPQVTADPVHTPPTISQRIKAGLGVGVSFIFGPPTIQTIQSPPVVTTNPTVTAFEQCIAEHRDDIGACVHLASGQSDIKK